MNRGTINWILKKPNAVGSSIEELPRQFIGNRTTHNFDRLLTFFHICNFPQKRINCILRQLYSPPIFCKILLLLGNLWAWVATLSEWIRKIILEL